MALLFPKMFFGDKSATLNSFKILMESCLNRHFLRYLLGLVVFSWPVLQFGEITSLSNKVRGVFWFCAPRKPFKSLVVGGTVDG